MKQNPLYTQQYDLAVRYKDANKQQRVATIHGNPFTIKTLLECHGAKLIGFRFIGGNNGHKQTTG